MTISTRRGEFEKINVVPNEKEGFTTITLTTGLKTTPRECDTSIREKRRRILEEQFEDLTSETVAEIIATINDPKYMTGLDVSHVYLFSTSHASLRV